MGSHTLLKASFVPKAPLFPVPPALRPLPIFLEDTGIEWVAPQLGVEGRCSLLSRMSLHPIILGSQNRLGH